MTNERGEFTLQHVSAGEYYVFAEPVDKRGGSRQLESVLTRSGDDDADAANLAQFKKNNLKINVVDGQRNVGGQPSRNESTFRFDFGNSLRRHAPTRGSSDGVRYE